MDKKHFKCLLWKGLWGIAVLSLIAEWSSMGSGAFLGFGAEFWFWHALIFAVLSIPIKLDCYSCDVCGIGPRA